MKIFYIFLTTLLSIVILVGINAYVQKFNQDSETTATSGWYFQTTLNLKEYKNVSTGNDLWGQFNRYTRSDRMGPDDVLTIYCNQYCKD